MRKIAFIDMTGIHCMILIACAIAVHRHCERSEAIPLRLREIASACTQVGPARLAHI
jgi:hypothetical protein